MERFSKELKEARHASGLTPQEVSERTLIPKRLIESWETEDEREEAPPPYVKRFLLNELNEAAKNPPKRKRKAKVAPVEAFRNFLVSGVAWFWVILITIAVILIPITLICICWGALSWLFA